MTDTDYDRFMDAVSSQFEQHLQRLFPDDYGLQRIAWDAWDDFRRTKEYDGPVVLGQSDGPMTKRPKRDPNGRVIDLAKLDPAEAQELHDALVEAFDALGEDDKPQFSPQADDYYGDIPDEVIAAEKRRDAERAKDFEGQWEYVDGVQLTPTPEGGWVGLQAIQSESVLGEHDGVLDDDLVQTIFGTETKP